MKMKMGDRNTATMMKTKMPWICRDQRSQKGPDPKIRSTLFAIEINRGGLKGSGIVELVESLYL
jgi:hypothetical protein